MQLGGTKAPYELEVTYANGDTEYHSCPTLGAALRSYHQFKAALQPGMELQLHDLETQETIKGTTK